MNKYITHIFQNVGASGVSYVIALGTAPLMTRLFPAEAFGVNAMLLNVATLVTGFGLMGVPAALAGEHDKAKQKFLLLVAVVISYFLFACSVVLSLGIIILSPELLSQMGGFVLSLFPLLVLGFALQRTVDAFATANGWFSAIAGARLLNAVMTRGSALSLGWALHASAAFMVIADIAGKLSHLSVFQLTGKLSPIHQELVSKPKITILKQYLNAYQSFVFDANLANILPVLSLFIIQLAVTNRFGLELTGRFVLAQSMLTVPVSVFSMAAASVLFHRYVSLFKSNPGYLFSYAVKIIAIFWILGVIFMVPLCFFGELIFSLAFGEDWRLAGKIAEILCLPQILLFGTTISVSLFRVIRCNRIWFITELAGVALIAFAVSFAKVDGILAFMIFLALVQLAYYLCLQIVCLIMVYRASNGIEIREK